MGEKIVKIESHNNYKGMHGSLDRKNAIMVERSHDIVDSIAEVIAAKLETTSGFDSKNTDKGVSNLEITPKEYIDDRINSLEKSMDDKFNAQDQILSGKFDLVEANINHLHTKIESSLETKFNLFKTQLSKEQKESRRFLITTILASVGIATAIIIGTLGYWIK